MNSVAHECGKEALEVRGGWQQRETTSREDVTRDRTSFDLTAVVTLQRGVGGKDGEFLLLPPLTFKSNGVA